MHDPIPLAVVAEYVKNRELYGKLEKLAKGANSSDSAVAAEARNAARRASDLLSAVNDAEDAHPGIREVATRVLAACAGPATSRGGSPDRGPSASGPGTWAAHFEPLVNAGISAAVGVASAALSNGVARRDYVGPGECVLDSHACAEGQVCVELRMRATDALQPARLSGALTALGKRIRTEAKNA